MKPISRWEALCIAMILAVPLQAQPTAPGSSASSGAAPSSPIAPQSGPPPTKAPPAVSPLTANGAPTSAAAATGLPGSTPSGAGVAPSPRGAPASAGSSSGSKPTPSRPPSSTTPTEAPADAEQRIDLGLELLHDQQHEDAAASLYGIFLRLPENDLRRDMVAFHMASALVRLGLTQAAVEHYLDIVMARRSPDLIPKTLAALQPLFEKRMVDETRFVDNLLFGAQFGEVLPESEDFVEYLQALGDLRHGFADWGRSRLEELAKKDRPYAHRAKYLLAVERIAQKQDDGAEKLLRQVLAGTSSANGAAVPAETMNQCRLALARILYERKNYDEAWKYYSQIDLPLPLQDTVLLEKAWDRVASGDHGRALGMLVGLGAPVFRRVFAPERDLVRALALRRLCQYRAAHLTVTAFRSRYGATIAKIRNRDRLADDPTMRQWAMWNTTLLETARLRNLTERERRTLGTIDDKDLRAHVEQIYVARISELDSVIARGLARAIERVADELLRIEEQMNLIDYEMGAGLFASSAGTSSAGGSQRSSTPAQSRPSAAASQVSFRFDGEYWSDELSDFVVITEDRCLH